MLQNIQLESAGVMLLEKLKKVLTAHKFVKFSIST
jgi:hypothetical protein